MKAIVLYQPYATLMAIGVKKNETRPRPWAHVGDVAICAAKLKWTTEVPEWAIPALEELWAHRRLVDPLYLKMPGKSIQTVYNELPFGKVVCVVEKTGCVSTNDDNGDDRSLTPVELKVGNYEPNRFYYSTKNVRRLTTPVRVIGSQGVFELPATVESLVRRQLVGDWGFKPGEEYPR